MLERAWQRHPAVRRRAAAFRCAAAATARLAGVVLLLAGGGCADWPFRYTTTTSVAAGGRHAPAAARPDGTAADGAQAEPETSGSAADRAGEPLLYPGTGTLLAPAGAGASPPPLAGGPDVTLNFADAGLREVVRSVLGEILRLNYAIDPTVKGSVTLQTSRPVARSALLPILEQVLQLNGAALVRDGDLYKVVPLEQAAKGGVPPARLDSARQRAGFGLEVVSLRHIGTGQMTRILQSVAPADRIRAVDPLRNLLIIAGTGQERATLHDLVTLFDVDWLAGMSFALVPVHNVGVKTLLADLQQVFGDPATGELTDLVRLVPVERVNALLVITPQAALLDTVSTWVERLDQGVEAGERRLYVYYVKHGRAAELAEVLTEIFAEPAAAAGEAVELAPGLSPVELRVAPARPQAAVQQEPADAAATAPSAPRRPPPGTAPQDAGRARIIPDNVNNALAILATAREYRLIEAALRKLDIVQLQVLIEATIAEVTLNDALRYGVQWFFRSGDSEFSLSEVASGQAAQAFPGFSYLLSGGDDVRLVLNALDEVTDVNVVSSPQLMVLNNRSARLQVGDQVPVATQSAVSVADPEAPIVNQIQFQDTGVILEVKPQVNAGGMVALEIIQEVSDVISTTTSGIDSPTIQQRRIASTIAVHGGETIALGGLIRDRKEKSSTGVPVFKDLPVIGPLFGARRDDTDRTELLVLITPRVVGSLQEAREVTEELRGRMRTLEPLRGKVE